MLQQIYSDISVDQNYRDIAFLLSIMNKYSKSDTLDELDKISINNKHFSMLAKEIKAYSLYEKGNKKEAQNLLEDLTKEPFLNQRTKERIHYFNGKPVFK